MLSIVVPVYNEEESLKQLVGEIHAVAEANSYELDIIFIDDGSTDRSWQIIDELAKEHSHIRGIRFRRNFGKAAALDVGFKAAKGEVLMTLDADLQDNPAEIPEFLKQLDDEGLDVISGWKKTRHDPWHKVYPSRVFNGMVSWLTGVKLHDHNCGMKCYRAEVIKEVTLYGELHRFVPVLADARGFKVGEKVVEHRARQFGSSKYGVTRFIKGFLDLLTVKFVTGYGKRPQHLLGTAGVSVFSIGALMLAYMALRWAIARIIPLVMTTETEITYHLGGRPAVIYAVGLMLLGAQLLSTGVVSELLVAYHKEDTCDYSIKETTGGDDS